MIDSIERMNQIRTEHTKFCSDNGHSQGTGKEHLIEQIVSLQYQLEHTDEICTQRQNAISGAYSQLRSAKETIKNLNEEKDQSRKDTEYWVDAHYKQLGRLRIEEQKYSDANAENAKLKRIISEAHASFHAD